MSNPPRASVFVLAGLCLSLVALQGTASGQGRGRPGGSQWWDEVAKVEELARGHKWKPARKKVAALAREVSTKSWYDPELGRILAELALLQAVVEANLGRDWKAIWLWHAAVNLDFKLRKRDLGPYGKAAKLLYEHPLRARGEVPAGFESREASPLQRSERVEPPVLKTVPSVVNNAASLREGSGDFHVEVIVDTEGRLHHPVVVSTYLHPVVTYGALVWMLDLPPFEPRRVEGEPTDSVYDLVVELEPNRW